MSIKETIIRQTSMGLLKVRKYAPEILTAGAILSGGAALGFTVKQTLTVQPCFSPYIELKEKVAEHKENVRFVHEEFEAHKDEPDFPVKELPPDEYTPEKELNDKMIVSCQVAINILKHYTVPLMLAGLSTACVLGLYKVWKARYTAVVAAYTGLQSMYERYKNVVKEKFGEETEKEVTALAIDRDVETKKDLQTGKKIRQYKQGSQYARIFDEMSCYYKRTPGENLSFLQRQQALANNMLKINGSLFLNEVYDMLGFPRTQAGSVVGWVHQYGRDHEVDFGFWDLDNVDKRAFINGWEKSVLLDFNVDGVIYDLI